MIDKPAPDERLRAAAAAIAEREHLQRVRAALVPQVQDQERTVQLALVTLQREQADVDRLGHGVIGFLTQLLGDNLTREQQEVQEAAAKLREAVAMRDLLRGQLVAIDQRLAQLANADAELAAARAAKELEVRADGGPLAAQLEDLDIQMMSIDIELVPMREAVAAGHAALAALAELVAMLEDAALSEATRKRATETRGLAGEVEAKLRVWQTELAELASFELEVPDAVAGDGELGPWVERLLAGGDRGERIAAARDDLAQRITRLRARLEPVRARHEELATRRAGLEAQRAELITAV